jgi:hypothetical protein
MKQKIYILGVVAAMILVTGAMFKLNHWPAAGILITIGTFLIVALFLPAALLNHYKAYGNRQNRLLYIVTFITCFVVFIAMLFKIMHWPYAGYIILIAVPFPFVIFLPVWLYVTSKIKNFDINNTIFVLFLLAVHAVFTAFLSLNVARDRIYDSLEFSKNLYSLNHNIGNRPVIADRSALDLSAADVIKQIDECRQLLFVRAGITREELNNGTGNDKYFDSRNIGPQLLLATEKPSPAMKLEESVRNFVHEIDKIPGYQELAKQTAGLLELNAAEAEGQTWAELMFADDYLSWIIINLDAMENIVTVINRGVLN